MQPDVKLYLNGEGDREVKRRTGFQSEKDLLVFIVILHDGDFDVMVKKSSILTWYEEFFFFRCCMELSGRKDTESIKHGFGIDAKPLLIIFNTKLGVVTACRDRCP